MENKDKKYEIIMNNSVNILKVFSMIGFIVLFTICIINDLYDLPKIHPFFDIPLLHLF